MERGRMRRGWRLAAKSWNTVESNRSLLVLPLLSALTTMAAAVVIFTPAAYYAVRGDSKVPFVVGAVVAAYPFAFVSTFFGVAFIAVAQRTLAGEPATVRDGLACARSRLGPIAAWSLLSTLVGLALQALQRVGGGGLVGRITAWILGAAWSLGSFFVVPIIALEGPGPIQTMRRSVRLIRSRWGEGVTGSVVIGGAFGLLVLPVVVLGMIGWYSFSDSHVFGVAALAIAAALFIALIAAQAAVNQVFHLALYQYALGGSAVGPFDEAELTAAFPAKRRLFGR